MFLGHEEWKLVGEGNIVKKAHVVMNHVEDPSKVTQFSSFSSKNDTPWGPRQRQRTHIKHCFYSFLRDISIKTWWAIKSLKAATTIWLPNSRRRFSLRPCFDAIFIRSKHLENTYWLKWSDFIALFLIFWMRTHWNVGAHKIPTAQLLPRNPPKFSWPWLVQHLFIDFKIMLRFHFPDSDN